MSLKVQSLVHFWRMKKCVSGFQVSVLTEALGGMSMTEMCILLMWAFRLPSFLNTQLQSMHGKRGTPLLFGRRQTQTLLMHGRHVLATTSKNTLLSHPFRYSTEKDKKKMVLAPLREPFIILGSMFVCNWFRKLKKVFCREITSWKLDSVSSI